MNRWTDPSGNPPPVDWFFAAFVIAVVVFVVGMVMLVVSTVLWPYG